MANEIVHIVCITTNKQLGIACMD